MNEFNAKLHAFLLENEMCVGTEKGKLIFGVHVYFHDLKEFVGIVGYGSLDDGGIECVLNNDRTLYIPLEDYFLNSNFTVRDYKDCFDESDLQAYAEQIEVFDRE